MSLERQHVGLWRNILTILIHRIVLIKLHIVSVICRKHTSHGNTRRLVVSFIPLVCTQVHTSHLRQLGVNEHLFRPSAPSTSENPFRCLTFDITVHKDEAVTARLVEVLHLRIGSCQRCLSLKGCRIVRLSVADVEETFVEEHVTVAADEIHNTTNV